jgi:hypothetical protein
MSRPFALDLAGSLVSLGFRDVSSCPRPASVALVFECHVTVCFKLVFDWRHSSGTRGCRRVQQDTDRQTKDLLAAGVRRDDLYVGHGVSGARASRPAFDDAVRALHDGDTLVITTLDRLGRSTQNMLALAEDLRGRGASLRVLNLGGGDVDTATPMGSMVFTVMAALAQMELEIKRERITDSVSKRRGGQGPRWSTPSIHRQPDQERGTVDRCRRVGCPGRSRHGHVEGDLVPAPAGHAASGSGSGDHELGPPLVSRLAPLQRTLRRTGLMRLQPVARPFVRRMRSTFSVKVIALVHFRAAGSP